MKKEVFLEDILERILNRNTGHSSLATDIKMLKDLIQYQRSFDNEELATILANFNLTATSTQTVSNKDLPYPVAHLLDGVNTQDNALVKVLFLCDAVECFVRWRFSEMLSLLHSAQGNLPDTSLGLIPHMITRPSMGSWNNGFAHLAKQLNDPIRKKWGVHEKFLEKDMAALMMITQKRNKLAHGDISGGNNPTLYWIPISQMATQIFDRYRTLKLEHFAVYNTQQYSSTGPTLSKRTATVPKWVHSINQSDNHFGVVQGSQSYQIPLTFMLRSTEIAQTNEMPFETLSYISTQGKVNTPTSGGSLEYTVLDGKGLADVKELTEFIELFKLDKDPSSNEPWNGLLAEVANAIGWDVDRDLLTHRFKMTKVLSSTGICYPTPNSQGKITRAETEACKQNTLEQIQQKKGSGTFWYIGGKAQSSKSTVLLSWLKNRAQKGTTYVFSHRFSKGDPTAELDTFFRTLQEALTLWLREQKSLPDPDTSLTGKPLRENINDLMTQFAELSHQPYLLLGLDDIHNLCNPLESDQEALSTLVDIVTSWSKHTKDIIVENFDHTRRVKTYEGQHVQQVFSAATALDISVGNLTQQTDIDDWMSDHPQVEFIYDISTLSTAKNDDENREDSHPTTFSKSLAPAQLERWNEIVNSFHNPSDNNPPGAHLPLIDSYGAKRLLLDENLDAHIVQTLQVTRGQTYVTNLVTIAKGNPSIIAAIGENLRNGHITIDDPITQASYDTILPSENNPFLQDISRLIPLLVVFLQRPEFTFTSKNTVDANNSIDETIQIPLTVTTLELLCSSGFKQTPQHQRYILEALHSIPRLVKRVALNESEPNGDLAFGWVLRTEANLTPVIDSDVLELTKSLATKRLTNLIENLDQLSDSLQLKDILLRKASGTATTSVNTSLTQQVFRELRGKLSKGIRSALESHTDPVLHNSASMLYQTKAIASPQITWLQKADESQRHQQDTNNFINQPAFDDFWLRHVNAEHFPIFNHQVSAVGYDEGVEHTILINAHFYLVIGGSKGVFNSISIYHSTRSIPDVELVGLSEAGKISDCIVQHVDSETVAVIYNIDQIIHVRIIKLGFQAKDTGTHTTHDYNGEVVQICPISTTQVGIFGKRATEKIYEIDVLSKFNQKTLHCQTISSGTNKEFNLAVSHLGAVFALYKEQLIKVDLDEKSKVQVSSICKLTAAPKQAPIKINDGIVSGGGSTKAKRNATWYSNSRHQAVTLKNLNDDKTFNLIIFAQELPNNRLLTVGYKGILRIHEWIEPKKKNGTPDVSLILEHQLQLDQEVMDAKNHGLIGGLLEGTRLLLYGVKSFMAFFDITPFININDDTSEPYPPSHRLELHYGTIKDARHISGVFFEHDDLFVTISEDNDARLWSFSSGDNNDDHEAYCVGLLRGHNEKMKLVEQCGDLLVTADTAKNLRTWTINDGCQNQLRALPKRSPSFIHSTFWYKNQVWVVATEGTDVYIQPYEKDGTTWSYQQALQRNAIPTCQKKYGELKVILLDRFFVLFINGSLQSFDLNTQTLAPLNLDDSDKGLKVKHIRYFNSGIIAYDDTNIYSITSGKNQLRINTVHTIPDDRFITAIFCTPKNNQPYQIHFATTIGTPKSKGALPREVWEITISNETVTTHENPVDTINETTRISGLWHDNGDILYWFDRSVTKAPLEYYMYRKSLGKRLHGPQKGLLVTGPTDIYRLPGSKGDGFVFRSGDSDRRWTLLYDYEYGEEGVSSNKSLHITVHPSWSYASTHFDDLITAFAEYPTVQKSVGVFAEKIPAGVVLHYKPTGAYEGLRLLWTGDSIGAFKIVQILPNGRIILKKNRDLIVLQLMKGNQAVSFDTLTDQQ